MGRGTGSDFSRVIRIDDMMVAHSCTTHIRNEHAEVK